DLGLIPGFEPILAELFDSGRTGRRALEGRRIRSFGVTRPGHPPLTGRIALSHRGSPACRARIIRPRAATLLRGTGSWLIKGDDGGQTPLSRGQATEDR